MVVFGGECFHDLDDLWLFNLNTNEWTEVPMGKEQLRPRARKFASSFKKDNKMYVIGGCHDKYESYDDGFQLDLSLFFTTKDTKDISWKEMKLSQPQLIQRWGQVSAVANNKAYVFGGRFINKDLENLVEIDLETGECQELNLRWPLLKGRRKAAFCIQNNTMFCHSGFDGSYLQDFLHITVIPKPAFSQPPSPEQSLFQPEELSALPLELSSLPSELGALESTVLSIQLQ